MTKPLPPSQRKSFEIAIICALRSEADAVEALFDIFWDDEGKTYGKAPGDPNAYTTGVIGTHNIVLAHMPGIGKGNAAGVAASFRSSFEGIRLALVVGICGGVPHGTDDEEEILLGDVIISDGLIEYDFGRNLPNKFIRKDTLQDNLARPNTEIQALLTKLKGNRGRMHLRENTSHHLMDLEQNLGVKKARYPGADADKLFEPTYRHKHHDLPACTLCSKCAKKEDEVCQTALESSCSELKCNDNKLVTRRRLIKAMDSTTAQEPVIHYGLIASGDAVMKSGEDRDAIAAKENVIAFEMEGAGVWDNFPCVVIKGVCDYADSHKNKEWQNYAAATAAACMKAFLKEWVPADKYIAAAAQIPPKAHWLVPFGRNKQFIGRHSQFEELFAKLDPEDSDEGCQRVAITGLGGVGKTQIALEAAFRMKKASPDRSVFWISATSTTSFEKSYRDIGQVLEIPGIIEDKADVKVLVKTFLSQESAGRWLLIIDNADDVEMLYGRADESNESSGSPALADYLPFSRKGSILFTTRNLKAAVKEAGVNVIILREMSESDSQKLLEMSLIDKNLTEGKDVTANLLDNLTHLPLAIKQAAAYMNKNKMSVSEYLALYEGNDDDLLHLLSEEFEDQGRYREVKNPIASTWLISFRQISSRDQLAEEYLCFMSCVAQQDIPLSLLPPATKLKQLEAIGTLSSYAFITKRNGQDSYEIHRLVQIAMHNWLKTKGQMSLWSGKALIQVAEVFPFPKHENRATWTTYLPHAQRVLSFQEYFGNLEESHRELLSNVGWCFEVNGKYAEAEQMLRQTLMLKEKVFDKEHPSTLGSMNNLAEVLRSQGKYEKAEQMNRQTLELRKKMLGKEHPSTLDSMNNLAIVLDNQGKYEEAEQMHRQTLMLTKKMLGEEHSSTLDSMNNLALVLDNQGKYEKAEQMHRQTLMLTKKMLGEEHSSTLDSMNNLAKVLHSQGKYEKTEQMHQQTLELRKKVLGKEHPDTLVSMSNLAAVLDSQGKYEEAESMYRQTLELRKKMLGKEHPDTIVSMSNLAVVLDSQGKYEEAESMYRQTLELRKKVLGKEHPKTLKSMRNLATVLHNQEKYEEAEQMHRQTSELNPLPEE